MARRANMGRDPVREPHRHRPVRLGAQPRPHQRAARRPQARQPSHPVPARERARRVVVPIGDHPRRTMGRLERPRATPVPRARHRPRHKRAVPDDRVPVPLPTPANDRDRQRLDERPQPRVPRRHQRQPQHPQRSETRSVRQPVHIRDLRTLGRPAVRRVQELRRHRPTQRKRVAAPRQTNRPRPRHLPLNAATRRGRARRIRPPVPQTPRHIQGPRQGVRSTQRRRGPERPAVRRVPDRQSGRPRRRHSTSRRRRRTARPCRRDRAREPVLLPAPRRPQPLDHPRPNHRAPPDRVHARDAAARVVSADASLLRPVAPQTRARARRQGRVLAWSSPCS